jgi:hypothetical protein
LGGTSDPNRFIANKEYDMQSSFSSGWWTFEGEINPDPNDKYWDHSHFKTAPYKYTYLLYDEFVERSSNSSN